MPTPFDLNDKIREEAAKINDFMLKSTKDNVTMFESLRAKKSTLESVVGTAAEVAANVASNYVSPLSGALGVAKQVFDIVEPMMPVKRQAVPDIDLPLEQLSTKDYKSIAAEAFKDIYFSSTQFRTDVSKMDHLSEDDQHTLEMGIYNLQKIIYDALSNFK